MAHVPAPHVRDPRLDPQPGDTPGSVVSYKVLSVADTSLTVEYACGYTTTTRTGWWASLGAQGWVFTPGV